MTRRDLLLLLTAAANESSRQIIRSLYAHPRRGARDRAGKLAPAPPDPAPPKTPKKR